ncbi:NERD domain-containing protein [Desulfofundulus salinus]|uniref:NERD domain-containing protein n=1 Tax=Desulfofundulus salinus TaxID=2419843 RepID=A0A494WR55_9FIRM|nr:NERD domain-containing protein [Desulfofundulus salinum]RKO65646.1 NERD domain-containing protein [Desulfofundulus salinum]
MSTVAKKLSALEKAMMELAYESRLTEIKLKQLAEGMEEFKAEMKAFKDEMKAFKDEMKAFKDEINKKWGELARKMGTLIEDIFVPSIDLAIEKYFHVVVKDVMPCRKIRRDGRTFEVDILALAGDLAFVVEVKASPNRVEYVHDFMEKLSQLPGFIPEVRDKKIVPIYAALDMAGSTVDLLTKNGIYAMVVRGDILEIVNFGALGPV